MSAFEKGGEVSFDEEAAFCEHFTMHELPDAIPTAACRKVACCLVAVSIQCRPSCCRLAKRLFEFFCDATF